MQIALGRNDEDVVWADDQAFRDQLDGHPGVFRKDLVQKRRGLSQMIDDDDGDAQIARQMRQQPDVGVEPTGGPAHANNGKVVRAGQGHGRRRLSRAFQSAPAIAVAATDPDRRKALRETLACSLSVIAAMLSHV
jgi:hypothetical protein